MAILEAFPIEQLEDVDSIGRLFTGIFQDQPPLAQQFWDYDALENTPLRRVLELFAGEFPSEFQALLLVLKSLVASPDSAVKTHGFFAELKSYQASLPLGPTPMGTENDFQIVSAALDAFRFTTSDGLVHCTAQHSFMVPNQPIQIPKGTKGVLVGTADGEASIRFYVTYSGWHLSLNMLLLFLQTPAQYANPVITGNVVRFLQLLQAVVQNSPPLIQELGDHLAMDFSPLVRLTRENETPFSADGPAYIPRLLIELIRRYSSPEPHHLQLLEAAVGCLNSFCKLGDPSIWLQAAHVTPDLMRRILAVENRVGRYKVTLAYLELVGTLLVHSQRWLKFRPGVGQKRAVELDLSGAVEFVRTSLWSSYDSWRYAEPKDRWMLTLRILSFFYQILHDADDASGPAARSLRQALLQSLLFDPSFHSNLLVIIGYGPSFLETALNRRRHEGVHLESLVLLGFTTLEKVLTLNPDPKAITPLENSILSRKGHGNDFLVQVIAAYVEYQPNPELVLSATRVLALLGTVAGQSPIPVSLLAYINETHQEAFRLAFVQRLQDPREHELLHVALLDFLSSCIDAQPGLASFLLRSGTQGSLSSFSVAFCTVHLLTSRLLMFTFQPPSRLLRVLRPLPRPFQFVSPLLWSMWLKFCLMRVCCQSSPASLFRL